MMPDSTQRFSNRVDDYVKYRPGYPPAVVDKLLDSVGLDAGAACADIGSGTGIFTQLLLDRGLDVFAVEPNPKMRGAAECALADRPNFRSIAATAEQTGLPDASVDLITAAQAFHWFNSDTTRVEFRRILKPGGSLALIWNRRRMSQPFQQAYEVMLKKYAREYLAVNHMNLSDTDIAGFFAEHGMQAFQFDHCQQFDLHGLTGRVKSSSYCPEENSPAFTALLDELTDIFNQFCRDGMVDFEYDTWLYLGPMAA